MDIPVVMITSSDEGRNRNRAFALGAAAFVKKSADLDVFVQELGNALPICVQS